MACWSPIACRRLKRRSALIGAPEREALQGIGLARFRNGDAPGALALLAAAEALGGDARCRHNLATVLAAVGRGAEAIALEERNLREAPDYIPPYFTLAQLRAQANEAPRAAAVLARLVERALAGGDDRVLEHAVAQLRPLAAAGEPVLQPATRLRVAGRSDQAASLLAARLAVAPDDLGAGLAHAMAQLTMVHGEATEIADRRARYAAALAELEAQVDRGTVAMLAEAAGQVGEAKPFVLAYHGENDVDLQHRYGRLVTRMIRAADAARDAAPSAARERVAPMPPTAALATHAGAPEGERDGLRPVRVGFATAYFHLHSVSKLFGGWMRHLDPARFAVFGYHLGQAEDATTAALAAACTRFHRGPRDDAGWIAAMRADALDVLIYPEIGMHPTAVRLATRRIAPLQCVAWGHPVTTGLPEIDVFLSSALMEPADGDAHYAERLVRLPGLSVCYTPQPAGTGRLDWTAFGIAAGDVAYLCCQSPFKYHPGDDAVLTEIAAAVPTARFVFIGTPARDANAARLRTRLACAFAAAGLTPDRHLLFVPHVPAPEFQALLRAGDVYLDSLRWSGGNTTLEAVTAGLPIVTTPGPLMRGRHSAAILTAMGLADHVSPTREAYVARAIALADPAARGAARAAVTARADRVAEDLAPVRALEAFLLAETRVLRPEPEPEQQPQPEPQPQPASA